MKKYVSWLAASVLALGLAGCKEEAQAPEAEVSRPVPIIQLSPSQLDESLRFPARVRAAQRADLAFKVPGQITSLPLNNQFAARRRPAS